MWWTKYKTTMKIHYSPIIRLRAVCLAALFSIYIALTLPAEAGAPNVPCKRPFIFSDAMVNAVVLPYTYAGSSGKPLSQTAKKLSLLIQVDTLFSALKYGSIGAVRLVDESGDRKCEANAVLKELQKQVKPGHGLVLLWGRIYEEKKDIYVQSYAHFLRGNVKEELELLIGNNRFIASLPTQAFAFAPRKLTVEDLNSIQSQFERSAIVHEKPDESSPGTPIPVDPDFPFSFWVVDVKDEWMRIKHMERHGPDGWIYAGPRIGGWPLSQKLPELSFVDALIGYLQARGTRDQENRKRYLQFTEWMQEALLRYQKASEGAEAPLATAIGKELNAVVRFLKPDRSIEDIIISQRLFKEAVRLIPYSADAHNLEIISRIAFAYQQITPPPPSPKIIAHDLVGAVALDPQNLQILSNLANFYSLLISKPLQEADPNEVLERPELELRLKAVKDIIVTQASSQAP